METNNTTVMEINNAALYNEGINIDLNKSTNAKIQAVILKKPKRISTLKDLGIFKTQIGFIVKFKKYEIVNKFDAVLCVHYLHPLCGFLPGSTIEIEGKYYPSLSTIAATNFKLLSWPQDCDMRQKAILDFITKWNPSYEAESADIDNYDLCEAMDSALLAYAESTCDENMKTDILEIGCQYDYMEGNASMAGISGADYIYDRWYNLLGFQNPMENIDNNFKIYEEFFPKNDNKSIKLP